MQHRGVKMAKISEQNARGQAVILPASVFCFEIEAILTSFGFDRFRPLLRWRTLSYLYSPATRRLTLNESASNLEAALDRF
jgi:hypothetical protein